MKEPDDAALMARAAAGDAGAFAAIVEKYQNILLNFFLRRGVSYDDGLDLAQRTFLKLWNCRARYERRAKFTTFLFCLAGHEAVDFFRSEGRRRGLEERLALEADAAADDRPRRENPADAAGDGTVRRAVAGLKPALRDVVELGVFQELPYAEIGGILGIPVGTVKSRMSNALKKLREMLA